jgi:VCBS repeat-containing protein
VFERQEDGKLSFLQMLKDGQNGVDGLGGAISVSVSSDGNTVYASGVFDKAIAVFKPAAPKISLDEDSLYSFTTQDFNFFDIDQGDSLKAVKITQLPAGTLFLDNNSNSQLDDGEAVAANADINVDDIAKLKYLPEANKNGDALTSFSYQVSDGKLYSSTATMKVNVKPVNDAPTITEGSKVDVPMDEDGTPKAFALTLNATDPDQDKLSWSIKTQGSKGTAAIDSNGLVSFKPTANSNGSDSFVVEVSDGKESSTITVNVTIAAINDAPAFTAIELPEVAENSAAGTLVGQVTATDPDSANLSYSITAGNSDDVFAIDNTGKITVKTSSKLNYETTKSYNLTITATDDGDPAQSATTQLSITVTDADDPLVISGDPATSVGQDVAYSFTPDVSDEDDLDPNQLSFVIENKPNWASFDEKTGQLSGTPTQQDLGEYKDIIIKVSQDGGKNFVSLDAFTLSVDNRNDAPSIAATSPSKSPRTAAVAPWWAMSRPKTPTLATSSAIASLLATKPTYLPSTTVAS